MNRPVLRLILVLVGGVVGLGTVAMSAHAGGAIGARIEEDGE